MNSLSITIFAVFFVGEVVPSKERASPINAPVNLSCRLALSHFLQHTPVFPHKQHYEPFADIGNKTFLSFLNSPFNFLLFTNYLKLNHL